MKSPKFRRFLHTDRVVYVACVLWMIGHSQRSIARALGLRPKQVSGIIENAGFLGRASMSDGERAKQLADLEQIRFGEDGTPLDGGALNRIPFKIRALDARQVRGPLRRKVQR